MALHSYRFLTHWRVKGTCEEAFDILDAPLEYPRWWPAVWLRTEEVSPGDAIGIGKVIRLTTKGWLPYILRWESKTVAKDRPRRLEIAALGDFVGRGVWTFRQEGEEVAIDYQWELDAEKPLLRFLSPILKPLFAWNHNWAMKRGEESLQLELQRRRGAAHEIASPPGPVFMFGKPRWLVDSLKQRDLERLTKAE